MTDRQQDLAALVASRLCHDLISPLGAIGNGVELLALSGSTGPEIDLIGQSVSLANARLRLFRIAFGAASSDQTVPPTEVAAIFADLARAGRGSYVWDVPGGCPRREAKLALLGVLCLETALAYGGDLVAECRDGRWALSASASKLRPLPDLWDSLALGRAPSAAVAPAHVQFPLFAAEARTQDRVCQTSLTDTRITLAF